MTNTCHRHYCTDFYGRGGTATKRGYFLSSCSSDSGGCAFDVDELHHNDHDHNDPKASSV